MTDRSDDPWHHERTFLPQSYISLKSEIHYSAITCISSNMTTLLNTFFRCNQPLNKKKQLLHYKGWRGVHRYTYGVLHNSPAPCTCTAGLSSPSCPPRRCFRPALAVPLATRWSHQTRSILAERRFIYTIVRSNINILSVNYQQCCNFYEITLRYTMFPS